MMKKDRFPSVSPRTKLLAVTAGLAVAASGCGKDNSSVHDIVLGCSDKSEIMKSFAVVNLDDDTKIKGQKSHRSNSPFNTSSVRDSFPEDRSLGAAAIFYECAPAPKQNNIPKGTAPNPEGSNLTTSSSSHDRQVTLSINSSESDIRIGTKSYVGGSIFDGDIPLAPNTEGVLVYAVKNHGSEPNGNQSKLDISSVTGIHPDEVEFHSSDIEINPPESPF